jgi:DNA-directed RNA polymerase sigma subunit (sigma70/sigma32)
MTPELPDDDARAEILADEAVDFACRHHPAESARFRRRIARLYIQLRLDPSARTAANTATLLGVDRRRVPEIEATALAKLRHTLRQKNPEIFT